MSFFSFHKIELIGNVGRDPQQTLTNPGREFWTFSIAVQGDYKKRDTNTTTEKTEKPEPIWYKVVSFNEHINAKRIPLVKKGSKVYVMGTPKFEMFFSEHDNKYVGINKVILNFTANLIILSKSESDPTYIYTSKEEYKRAKGQDDAQKCITDEYRF